MIIYTRTSSKKRKTSKALAQSWNDLTTKWANVPKYGRGPVPTLPKQTVMAAPTRPPSKPDLTPALKVPSPQYTGTSCIGIATMHKSNLVPVFTSNEAVDLAHMRR